MLGDSSIKIKSNLFSCFLILVISISILGLTMVLQQNNLNQATINQSDINSPKYPHTPLPNAISSKLSSYTNSSPIVISGDSAISSYSSSGSGTASNPYIIQGYRIVNSSNNAYGIEVENVYYSYFVIENNILSMNGSGSSSIYFTSVSSYLATIKNNTFSNDNYAGIDLWESGGVLIENNTFTNENAYGVFFDFMSDNNVVTNNIVTNITSNNAFFVSTTNNTFSGNIITNDFGDVAFFLRGGETTITHNTVLNSKGAIFEQSTQNNTVTFNTISNSSTDAFYIMSSHDVIANNIIENTHSNEAIYLSSSTNITIENNFLSQGSNNAIYEYNPSNVTLTNNTFMNFSSYALFLTGITSNKVYLNNFLNNNGGGQQAFQSDNKTVWNNGTYGNFWLDYNGIDANSNGIGDTPYFFNGGNDSYPIMIWHGIELPPQFLIVPASKSYDGTQTFNLTWKAIDDNPNTYAIYADGILAQSGSFFSKQNITLQVLSLVAGLHNFTIVLTDLSNNKVVNTVNVTSVDQTPPIITGLTTISYNESSTGNFVTWNVSDVNPADYQIFFDGISVKNGSWNNTSSIVFNVDGYLKGTYNITLETNDTSNNIATFMTTLTVFDGTHPTINHPANLTYEYGYSGYKINWLASDNYPNNYFVYKNGSIYQGGYCSSVQNISVNLDLLPGLYNFTIIVYDLSGLTATDTVFINVTPDVTKPVVTHPADIIFVYGTTGHILSWSATDFHPGNYSIIQNGSIVFKGTWTNSNPVQISLNSLAIGSYNYSIIFYDTFNNSVSDLVWVTVYPYTYLSVNYPANLTYNEGSPGPYSISWIITSNATWSYTIDLNYGTIESGSGSNNQSITYDLPDLSYGGYLFNFTVSTATSFVTRYVFVIVEPNLSPPVITIANNSLVYNPFIINIISWHVTGFYPLNYTIYNNGTLIQSNTWINNSFINISLNSLSLTTGWYNFTLKVTNSFGINSSNSVSVLVSKFEAPTIIETPNTIVSFNEQNTNKTVFWTAIDTAPYSYEVFINSSLYSTGSWINNTEMALNFNSLILGTYNVTIVVADYYALTTNLTFELKILDTISPLINQPGNITFTVGQGSHIISWNGTDLHPGIFIIYENGTKIMEGSWNDSSVILEDISNLQPGYYNFTIILLDSSNNSIISIVFVKVINIPQTSTSLTTTTQTFISSTSSSSSPSGSSGSFSSSNSTSSSNTSQMTTAALNGLFFILILPFFVIFLKRRHK